MEIFCIFWIWEVIMEASDAELNGANGTSDVNWTLVINKTNSVNWTNSALEGLCHHLLP